MSDLAIIVVTIIGTGFFGSLVVASSVDRLARKLDLSNRHLHEIRRIVHPHDDFPRDRFDSAE
jgi:hypothetical protein